MTPCPICQHPKLHAINAALAQGVAPGIVARRYRLEPLAFGLHVAHRSSPTPAIEPRDDPVSLPRLLITENPYRQFTRGVTLSVEAYQLAKEDPRLQRQMREYWQATVQSLFAQDDIGHEWA